MTWTIFSMVLRSNTEILQLSNDWFYNIHSHIVLFLSFSKYEWNEIPVNKSSRISAINRITNFSCVNPSRRNIRTHGIWIYDALLNQGFVIVFLSRKIFWLNYFRGKSLGQFCAKKSIEIILKNSTYIVDNIVK